MSWDSSTLLDFGSAYTHIGHSCDGPTVWACGERRSSDRGHLLQERNVDFVYTKISRDDLLLGTELAQDPCTRLPSLDRAHQKRRQQEMRWAPSGSVAVALVPMSRTRTIIRVTTSLLTNLSQLPDRHVLERRIQRHSYGTAIWVTRRVDFFLYRLEEMMTAANGKHLIRNGWRLTAWPRLTSQWQGIIYNYCSTLYSWDGVAYKGTQ